MLGNSKPASHGGPSMQIIPYAEPTMLDFSAWKSYTFVENPSIKMWFAHAVTVNRLWTQFIVLVLLAHIFEQKTKIQHTTLHLKFYAMGNCKTSIIHDLQWYHFYPDMLQIDNHVHPVIKWCPMHFSHLYIWLIHFNLQY